MSRRRGEFEHRTSIFEGAFRAWSHLGGLDPEELESRPSSELDPLSNPIQNDPRLSSEKNKKGKDAEPEVLNENGTKRRIYPYEPLPRSGLAHPYVQAILSPWLGPDADNDAIQLGLTTLRTWWQHRRKGESGSAIAALGTEKMKGVVEGYTRHFFALAHCLVMNDKEQPPRTLHSKMKDLEKVRNKRNKKKGVGEGGDSQDGGMAADLSNTSLSPLERLHLAQQRNLAVEGGLSNMPPPPVGTAHPIVDIKNKCAPSKVDLPKVVDAVNRQANQLAHSGATRMQASLPSSVLSSSGSSSAQYGDADTFPIVYVSGSGDILLAMSVDGITCAHCVKIVETVLKGCNGNKSPIDALLDAAADFDLCSVLVKIEKVRDAKRVAFEAARNLAMVGYTAKAKVMNTYVEKDGGKVNLPDEMIMKAFVEVSRTDPTSIFDWKVACSCPDNGVLRSDCSRHSQMSPSIFEAFEKRAMQSQKYLAGSSIEAGSQLDQQQDSSIFTGGQRPQQALLNDQFQPQPIMQNNPMSLGMNGGLVQNSGMDLFSVPVAPNAINMGMNMHVNGMNNDMVYPNQRAKRNSSILSFGGRAMSIGDASYGRAMSGLSALSIDWENMDDFDINVDHSAHINNDGMNLGAALGHPAGNIPLVGGGNTRRSSFRQFMVGGNGSNDNNDAHVSFKA